MLPFRAVLTVRFATKLERVGARMRIFFGDMVHTWEKVSVWTIPLNVGYVAAYTAKHFPGAEIDIFKDPEELLAAVRRCRPDVVALSSYAWNENLTRFLVERVKAIDPSILTVEGGPNFTVQNSTERYARPYLAKHASCDSYVMDAGERPMVALLERWIEHGGDPAKVRADTIPGNMTNDLAANDRVNIGPALLTLDILDEIPSPYLTGMLDRFLDGNFVPMLETNRSCPYQCTFCTLAVSTGSKLKTFSMERVLAEIDYISERTKSDYLITTDANFGILDRDTEIADHFYKVHKKHNFPGHLCVVWNKTRPDRVMKAARAFRGLAAVGASMQSMQPEVLEVIKRKNLPIEVARDMSRELQSEKTGFFSELIAGLPKQTFEGHINDNKVLMDLGANVYNYNLRLLHGTEMNTDESRARYVVKSGWRLTSDAFGVYEGVPVFEGEEVVLATPSMSEEEIRDLRLIHFLLMYMWGKGFFLDYVQLFRSFGFHPMDVILATARAMWAAAEADQPGSVGALFRNFATDHALEKFATYDELCAYWSQPDHLERLRRGDLGKLNSFHGLELISQPDAFIDFLGGVAKDLLGGRWAEAKPLFVDILRFTRETIVDVLSLGAAPLRKSATFGWDIVGWRAADHDPALPGRTLGGVYSVEFFRDEREAARLAKSVRFFAHENERKTLRTLFDMRSSYFLYHARGEAAAAAAE